MSKKKITANTPMMYVPTTTTEEIAPTCPEAENWLFLLNHLKLNHKVLYNLTHTASVRISESTQRLTLYYRSRKLSPQDAENVKQALLPHVKATYGEKWSVVIR